MKGIGYKIMRFENEALVSGANSRLSFPSKIGTIVKMGGNGIYMSPNKSYVIGYYSGLAENEKLIGFEYNIDDIITGNLDDKEPEISVNQAKIISIEDIDDEMNESIKSKIKKLLRESFQPNEKSILYLKKLKDSVYHGPSKKFITNLINKGDGNKVKLSDRELMLLKLIQSNGKFDSKDFSSINENLDFSGFKMNDELNPVIWDGDKKMKEEISETLLQIAKDYFISLKINIPVKDITMTGSLSNYNWSKYSDVDLHIIIDLDKMGDKKDIIKDLLDTKTRAWNDKHDITVKGYDVELYLQPYDQEHFSTGVYSVLNDEWVIEPKIQDDTIDKKNVVKKYNSIVNTVNDIHKDFAKKKDYKDVVSRLESLSDKIKKTRTAGLEGKGEYSLENIVFKLLRRNNIMEKIGNLLAKAYDESMSIDEELMKPIIEEEVDPNVESEIARSADMFTDNVKAAITTASKQQNESVFGVTALILSLPSIIKSIDTVVKLFQKKVVTLKTKFNLSKSGDTPKPKEQNKVKEQWDLIVSVADKANTYIEKPLDIFLKRIITDDTKRLKVVKLFKFIFILSLGVLGSVDFNKIPQLAKDISLLGGNVIIEGLQEAVQHGGPSLIKFIKEYINKL